MFFKKEGANNKNFLIKVSALLIHAARIDEKYTDKEEEIIKKTLEKFKKAKVQVIKITDSYLSPFEGVKASFFFIKGMGIVEIMDKDL